MNKLLSITQVRRQGGLAKEGAPGAALDFSRVYMGDGDAELHAHDMLLLSEFPFWVLCSIHDPQL